jgi:hypothetical protein
LPYNRVRIRFAGSARVNLPENLPEFFHFLIRSESNPEHLVQGRKGPTYCHTTMKHFLDPKMQVTQDTGGKIRMVETDVQEISSRLKFTISHSRKLPRAGVWAQFGHSCTTAAKPRNPRTILFKGTPT